MIYWTVVKFLQMIEGFSNGDGKTVMAAILFWVALTKVFWRAYRVEKEREKLTPQNTKEKTTARKVISNLLLLIIALLASYTFIHISDGIENCKTLYHPLLQSSCVTSVITSNLFGALGLSIPMVLFYFWIKPKK
jgi:hypothetical protein